MSDLILKETMIEWANDDEKEYLVREVDGSNWRMFFELAARLNFFIQRGKD